MTIFNIFFDAQDNFQWASIAAFIALIGSIVSAWISSSNNKKTLKSQKEMNESNFKGNIVAKSRIEWIQEVRKKSAEFIAICFDLFEFMDSHDNPYNLDSEAKREFSELKNELSKNGALLVMYFGPDSTLNSNKNNDLIAFFIYELVSFFTYEHDKEFIKELQKERYRLDILKDFLRIYFKAEWKRANGEIEDTKVQEYLDGNELYSKIFSIYKDELEDHESFYRDCYSEVERKILLKRNLRNAGNS